MSQKDNNKKYAKRILKRFYSGNSNLTVKDEIYARKVLGEEEAKKYIRTIVVPNGQE